MVILPLDLRSDTLTQPTPAMREVMMSAPVGDSFYDEDPSVRELEDKVASLFAKEAALFMPSGTLSNQIAIRLHCRPGDAVMVPAGNHIVQYETGALAALNGVQHMEAPVREGFLVDTARLREHISPQNAIHAPATALVAVENTHLRSGGRVYPWMELADLYDTCRSLGLPLHLDGARIWNASVQEDTPLQRFGEVCDTLSVCFSKGLGAPVGSCLVGSRAHIALAKRYRKMFGGTMRQCGFLAAAANYALEHHLERLKEDHTLARKLAEFLRRVLPGARVPEPETNIVLVHLPQNTGLTNETPAPLQTTASELLSMLHERYGLRMSALDTHTLRAVLHLNISREDLLCVCALP